MPTASEYSSADKARSHRTGSSSPVSTPPEDESSMEPVSADKPQLQYLNIAAYKFVSLGNLEELRRQLKQRCLELELRGTILLSPEGINLFLAGIPEHVRQWLSFIRSMPAFADLEAKESFSKKIPFRRMLVRLKKEIIPCGKQGIKPNLKTSPKLPATELKRWLDEGRSLRLLDVRNDYEVELGTFHGAEQLQLGHFRDFSAAIEKLPEESKEQPLVMFCTGGIRCEKAGPIMEQAGFREVYQLDGGILKYFEECGGAHWDGSCFVFDGRVALDPELKPTGNLLCFACQAVLTAEDVSSGRFMFGEYCPNCYRSPEERMQESLELRQQEIFEVARSQPGSSPYTNIREIHVAGSFDGLTLIEFLKQYQPAIEEADWRLWIKEGQIKDDREQLCDCNQIVRAGNAFVQEMPNTVEPEINPEIRLLYQDDSLVVIDKPAPLPCHASGRYNRNTLLHILSQAFPREKLRLAHRLDARTTGLVVLCRRHRAARNVQNQFATQAVKKSYVARVHGNPSWESTTCDLPIAAAASGTGGVRQVDHQGPAAQTHFRVLQRNEDGTTLVEAIPLTGRTNQIRIHLQQLGHSIVGDTTYSSTELANTGGVSESSAGNGDLFSPQQPQAICLHAHRVSLQHPDSLEPVTFESPLPQWAE